MNQAPFQQIQQLLDNSGVEYNVYTHPECRTSEESARVRREAGMPDAIGAKALFCKVVVFMLPGSHILDKAKLKVGLPGLKQFRFSTKEELMDIAGVVPGCMPPFGSQIFERVSKLYISSALKEYARIALNAAKLDTSITLTSEDYFKAVTPDIIFDFSIPKE